MDQYDGSQSSNISRTAPRESKLGIWRVKEPRRLLYTPFHENFYAVSWIHFGLLHEGHMILKNSKAERRHATE